MSQYVSQCVAIALLSLLLTGCADVSYWQLRTFYGLDCRPEKLTPDGKCVPVKKGGSDVQTVARP